MRAFLEADWQYPRSRTRPNLPAAFSAVREDASKKDNIFKAGASETLALYPVLRYFLEVAVPADCIRAERASFLSVCHVLDLIASVKNTAREEACRRLDAVVNEFFGLHLEAYGTELVRPKHHYMHGHLTRQVMADHFWLD